MKNWLRSYVGATIEHYSKLKTSSVFMHLLQFHYAFKRVNRWQKWKTEFPWLGMETNLNAVLSCLLPILGHFLFSFSHIVARCKDQQCRMADKWRLNLQWHYRQWARRDDNLVSLAPSIEIIHPSREINCYQNRSEITSRNVHWQVESCESYTLGGSRHALFKVHFRLASWEGETFGVE